MSRERKWHDRYAVIGEPECAIFKGKMYQNINWRNFGKCKKDRQRYRGNAGINRLDPIAEEQDIDYSRQRIFEINRRRTGR